MEQLTAMAKLDFLEKIKSDLTQEIQNSTANVSSQQKHIECLGLLLALVEKEYITLKESITQ